MFPYSHVGDTNQKEGDKMTGRELRAKSEEMEELMDEINEYLVQHGVRSNKALEIKDLLEELFYLIPLE